MIDRLRRLTFSHPRLKGALREGWGLSREAAHRLGLPPPFDPAEFADIRAVLRDPVGQPGADPRVLFLSMRGWSTHLLWETTFARGVRVRGGQPLFASCGGRLPICDAANAHSAPPMPCHSCREYARTAIEEAGFEPTMLADLIDVREVTRAAALRTKPASVRECQDFEYMGIPFGEIARISTLWFLARGSLPDTAEIRDVYTKFLVSGQVIAAAFRELLDRTAPVTVFMLNGTFFMERLMYELAEARGIRCVTYERGYMTDTVVVTDAGFACDYPILEEDWRRARSTPLTAVQGAQLDEYLDGRQRDIGSTDPMWNVVIDDVDEIRRQVGIKGGRPLVGLFSNIAWDSAVQNKGAAYDSLSNWVVETIAGFRRRPDVDIVVRLHPAEVRVLNHRTLEPMRQIIDNHFKELAPNVRVIAPESPVSSYTLMSMVDIGLVYTSTVGLEMALRGKPVVVAAKAHYGGREFTWDADTPEEYWAGVDQLLASPPAPETLADRREIARRYAYEYFFRLMKRIDVVHEPGRARPRLTYGSERDLLPGKHPGLDEIVATIMAGRAGPSIGQPD